MVGPGGTGGRKTSDFTPLRSMTIDRARTSESFTPCVSGLPSDTARAGSPP